MTKDENSAPCGKNDKFSSKGKKEDDDVFIYLFILLLLLLLLFSGAQSFVIVWGQKLLP
jgi:hypothetical protein